MSDPSQDWDLLSSYAGLLSLACFSIYAGSYASLSSRDRKVDGGGDDIGEEEEEDIERLSSEDAYLFPIIGSVVLFGLYLILKFGGKEWINWLLQWYFTIVGVGSVGKACIAFSKFVMGTSRWSQYDNVKFQIVKGRKHLASLSLRTPSLFLLPLGAVPSILYTFGPSSARRSALLTDVLALSFSFNALSLLKLDSFKTGCVLLSGLFLYDIWWVFGTEVMVKVATTLDVPIKLLWPKSISFSAEHGFTMLGLGDIVIPGMFVALALRYDIQHAKQTKPEARAPTPYFHAALFAYAFGLATTMSVMHFFRKAQPALLYLSPACILSFFLVSLLRGEFQEAWAWRDEADEKHEDSDAASSDKNMASASAMDSANGNGLASATEDSTASDTTRTNNASSKKLD